MSVIEELPITHKGRKRGTRWISKRETQGLWKEFAILVVSWGGTEDFALFVISSGMVALPGGERLRNGRQGSVVRFEYGAGKREKNMGGYRKKNKDV